MRNIKSCRSTNWWMSPSVVEDAEVWSAGCKFQSYGERDHHVCADNHEGQVKAACSGFFEMPDNGDGYECVFLLFIISSICLHGWTTVCTDIMA